MASRTPIVMVLGSLVVRLFIRESRSLKDKRQVVRSVLERLKSGFNIAASEVDTRDDVKVATLGIVTVGTETSSVQHVFNQIQEALRRHPIAEYLGSEQSVGHEVV